MIDPEELKVRHTVGENQELWEKVGIEGTEHNIATEMLSEALRLLLRYRESVDIDELKDDITDLISAETEVEGDRGWENFYLTKKGDQELAELLKRRVEVEVEREEIKEICYKAYWEGLDSVVDWFKSKGFVIVKKEE